MKCAEKLSLWRQRQISGLPRLGWEKGLGVNRYNRSLWVVKMF